MRGSIAFLASGLNALGVPQIDPYTAFMRSTDYHFVTNWRVKGSCQAVYDLLLDAEGYVRWWGDCYLDVKHLQKEGVDGLGGLVRIVNRGKLPYTLEWFSSVKEKNPPHGFTITASGELAGEGRWIFEQDGDYVNITFFWDVHFRKPFLKHFSFILRPFFVINHDYVMNRGEKHLQEELLRKR
jgi:hypothetical protein